MIWRRRLIMTSAAILLAGSADAGVDTRVERGRYLGTIAACVGCHTARSPNASVLAGGVEFGTGPDAPVSPNITPDDETGIGHWSRADIATALREGRRPDGTHIGLPMPQQAYAGLSDDDVAAIADFLKSVAPVHNAIVDRHHLSQPAAPRTMTREAASRGRYLVAAVAHCNECHGDPEALDVDRSKLRSFPGPNGPIVAPRLTPKRLASLSDEALEAIITKGIRLDGSTISGPMPVAAYAHLKTEDLAAVIHYLRCPAMNAEACPPP